MTQSRRASAFESVANVAIGFFIALVAQLALYPMFYDEPASFGQHLGITVCFTVISIVRSYVLRRAFNRLSGRCG